MPLRRAEAAAANFTSILIVPHALGLLATADEGKLASAAVLERGAQGENITYNPGSALWGNQRSAFAWATARYPFGF